MWPELFELLDKTEEEWEEALIKCFVDRIFLFEEYEQIDTDEEKTVNNG